MKKSVVIPTAKAPGAPGSKSKLQLPTVKVLVLSLGEPGVLAVNRASRKLARGLLPALGFLGVMLCCSTVWAQCPEGHEIAREQVGNTVTVYCGSDEQDRQMQQAKSLIEKSEKAGGFRSPLNNDALLAFLVTEAAKKGVPVWLAIGQAKSETTFGKKTNATVQDDRVFDNGTRGNAHNIFNLTPRPSDTKLGRVLTTTPKPGEVVKFAVYDSYKDGIRAYLGTVSGPLYKGLPLEKYLEVYFPKKQNGLLEFERYLRLLIKTAQDMGEKDIDRKSVPVP